MLIIAAGPAAAQSWDRDQPTPLTSNELTGELNGSGGESFYSFVARPGELTITADVTSSDGVANFSFELLDANGAETLLCCAGPQADTTGNTGRDLKSVKLARRQTVILHLTPNPNSRGSYRVRLSGPVVYGGPAVSEVLSRPEPNRAEGGWDCRRMGHCS